MSSFGALLAIDGRLVQRDALLRWFVLIPAVLALMVRFGVPALTTTLDDRFGFDLTPYYPLFLGMLSLVVPQFVGFVFGFVLLDQRDDKTLDALRVTPISNQLLALYRFIVPVSLSVIATCLVFVAAGTLPLRPSAIIAASISGAPFALVYGLIIATVSKNKVQGLAVGKIAGLMTVPAILAWFAPAPWQFLIGVFPTYWPAKAYWQLQAGEPWGWVSALIGVVWMVILTRWLLGRFEAMLASR